MRLFAGGTQLAGGPRGERGLYDLGLAAAVDHKAPDFAEQLARAVPEGIDTVYENVGAALLPALVPHLNRTAQIAVGGVMSQITRTGAFEGPDNLPDLLRAALYKTLIIRGFDVTGRARMTAPLRCPGDDERRAGVLIHSVAIRKAPGVAVAGAATYAYLGSARADLLRRVGRRADAAAAYEEALARTDNDVERAFLTERLNEVRTPLTIDG